MTDIENSEVVCLHITYINMYVFLCHVWFVNTGRTAYSDTSPGDNPVYDRGNTAVTLRGLTQTSAPVHYVNLSSSDRDKMDGSAPDRVFDNPIYGGNDEKMEDTYADPDANHHSGTGMGSAPYREFDNPIYGGEADENAHSLPANSSTENEYSLLADSSTISGTAAYTGQMIVNAKRGARVTGSDQVYDHVN